MDRIKSAKIVGETATAYKLLLTWYSGRPENAVISKNSVADYDDVEEYLNSPEGINFLMGL